MAHNITERRAGSRLLLVFQSKEEAYRFLVTRFCDISRTSISKRGVFTVALSGGKTPIDFYVALGKAGDQVDWKSIHVFLVDERFVPATDPESNYGMIKEHLLDAVPIPPSQVHPIITDGIDPWVSAERYTESMMKFFGSGPGAIPEIDFVLLGLGEEGHTGSLFPGFPLMTQQKHLVRAVAPTEGRLARVTLTLETINSGRHVFFLVTGGNKADIMRRVLVDGDIQLPATKVAPYTGELTFVADREAAAKVDPKHMSGDPR